MTYDEMIKGLEMEIQHYEQHLRNLRAQLAELCRRRDAPRGLPAREERKR